MGTYRLSKAISVPMDFIVWSNPNGKGARRVRLRLRPDEARQLPDDDLLFVQDIQKQEIKKRYDPKIEAYLDGVGVPFEVTMCRTCGGKKKFIVYKAIEVELDG